MNDENLISFKDMPKEKHLRLSSKGGRNSSRMQAGRRLLRETMDELLAEDDVQEKVVAAVIKKAIRGDVRAFQSIVALMGEDSPTRIEVSRGDAREAFIESHREQLLDSIRDEMDGSTGLAAAVGLTYAERRQIIHDSMMQREVSENSGISSSEFSAKEDL